MGIEQKLIPILSQETDRNNGGVDGTLPFSS